MAHLSKECKVEKTPVIEKMQIKKSEDQEKADMMNWFNGVRLPLFMTVIGTSLAMMTAFGLVGWLLDQQLGTKPILLIILVILSFPVTQLILYKRIQTIIKNK